MKRLALLIHYTETPGLWRAFKLACLTTMYRKGTAEAVLCVAMKKGIYIGAVLAMEKGIHGGC